MPVGVWMGFRGIPPVTFTSTVSPTDRGGALTAKGVRKWGWAGAAGSPVASRHPTGQPPPQPPSATTGPLLPPTHRPTAPSRAPPLRRSTPRRPYRRRYELLLVFGESNHIISAASLGREMLWEAARSLCSRVLFFFPPAVLGGDLFAPFAPLSAV